MIGKFGPFEFPLSERYRFEEELGRGAMGTVYRAKDVRLGRLVAIKMLHPALTNELGVSRFQSEIRIAASLHHANIVGVHESGEADGRLFYVMDFISGETLRGRLKREKQLSPDDALKIVDDVAEGLQYAHDHGVVHRDVKPENIMLTEGRACIVDFGLALALGDVDTQRLTASGLSVGTPHYLSPEQASAEREIGPRADQYALACVLFEMLIGEPPFTGPTASSIAMRHISENPPPMRTRRKTVPAGLEAAVLRAMEKVPADRFASVKAFAAACRAEFVPPPPPPPPPPPEPILRKRLRVPLMVASIGIAAVLLAGVMLARGESSLANAIDDGFRVVTGRTLDSAKYVILPFASPSSIDSTIDPQARLGDAVAKWQGISVAGPVELQGALAGKQSKMMTLVEGRTVARSLRAAWFVMGTVSSKNGVPIIRAELRSTGPGVAVRTASVPLSADSDSAYAHLAYGLLFPGPEGTKNESASAGTQSYVAFAKYLQGKAAMRTWNLPLADSLFAAALRSDPDFPQAILALAQVRSWAHDVSPDVARLATRALDKATLLSPAERLHASALDDMAQARWAVACARYDSLLKRDSLDFAGWYGLSDCTRRDEAVIADRNSPSGMRFRGSHQRATIAIERAFDLLPSIDTCCVARAVAQIRATFKYVGSASVRRGFGQSYGNPVYLAFPEWQGDTIAFTPVPQRELQRAPPPTMSVAIRMQRNRLHSIASKRVTLARDNSDALAFLGETMELRGDNLAADTIHRARVLATDRSRILRLTIAEIWLKLKRALPSNERELVMVRALADSLMLSAADVSGNDASLLASVAAVTGNVDLATRLVKRVDQQSEYPELPQEVLANAQAFLVLAVMGGSPDSLRVLEARLTNGIANDVLPQHQAMMRNMFISRGASFAFPGYRSPTLRTLDTNIALIGAETAILRGDSRRAHDILMRAQAARANVPPASLTLDGLYTEAWLLASLGDSANALARIAPTMDAIQSISSAQLSRAIVAGSLLQAMRLRQSLLTSAGNHREAAEWKRATAILTDPRRP